MLWVGSVVLSFFSPSHSRITETAMTNSKLRIDLSNGLLEVEGDEAFVRDVYKDFKDQLAKAATAPHKPQQHSSPPRAPAAQPPAAKTPRGKGKPRSDYNGKLDKNLDLSGGKGIPSLKDYLKRFDARSLTKKDTVFIKYLQEFVGIEKVNVDHIYTCYDDVGKIPGALRQSLRDASGEGLIEFSDPDNITLAIKGINWLKEQEAAKAKEAAE